MFYFVLFSVCCRVLWLFCVVSFRFVLCCLCLFWFRAVLFRFVLFSFVSFRSFSLHCVDVSVWFALVRFDGFVVCVCWFVLLCCFALFSVGALCFLLFRVTRFYFFVSPVGSPCIIASRLASPIAARA